MKRKSGLADNPLFFNPNHQPSPTGEEETTPAQSPTTVVSEAPELDRGTERNSVRNSERFSERKSERTEIRSENRTAAIPIRRRTKRYSFEFYEDQIFGLKALKREAEDRGENVTLSDMAREAFDFFLNNRK
jgi:hypothetical protein